MEPGCLLIHLLRRRAARVLPRTAGGVRRRLAAAAAARRLTSSQAAAAAAATDTAPPPPLTAAALGISETANSYVSLGAFETMGSNPGRAALGIQYLEDALRVQEEKHSSEANPRRKPAKALTLAQSLLQVGRQYHQQQDPKQAIVHYQRAMDLVEGSIAAFREGGGGGGVGEEEGRRGFASAKALRYAEFMSTEICCGLGVAYNDLGREEEALELSRRALALRKEIVGKDHPSVAECLNNLGALFFGRKSLQKAVEYYEQALELLKSAAGGKEEGAYIALTLYNIGLCRAGLGLAPSAGSALRRALKIAEQALGPDHPKVELIRATLEQAAAPPPSAPSPPRTPAAAAPGRDE